MLRQMGALLHKMDTGLRIKKNHTTISGKKSNEIKKLSTEHSLIYVLL